MTTKIVHLIGQLGRGGAEKQLFRLCSALQNRGWTQSVISFCPGGLWKGRLETLGVRVHEIPRSPVKPWRYWRLWRFVKQEKPAILVSWSLHCAVYAQALRGVGPLRRVVNVRMDLTVDANSGDAVRLSFGHRMALEKADFATSNSDRALQALRRAGVKLPRCKVVCNIVPAIGRASPAEPTPTPRIVAIGSLKPRKAFDDLLRSLGLLAAEKRNFELLLAGEGPDRARLQNLAEQLGIADRVCFLDDVDDVPQLLATAHLLVHPSRNEGLSNAILEAMAERLPVVATSVGGTPEIIEDGRTGLLVPPNNPASLAAAIRRLLDDPDLRGQLGTAALSTIRERCCEANVAGQYEEVFHALQTTNGTSGQAKPSERA